MAGFAKVCKWGEIVLGGGYDRNRIKPLNPDGNVQAEPGLRVIGCHTGRFSGLNIYNPRPGFHYPHVARNDEGLQQARINGAVPVLEGDEEYAAYRDMIGMEDVPHMQHTDLDSTYSGYGDLILMRMPEHKYRALREAQQRQHQSMFRECGVESSFIERGHSNPGEDHIAQTSRHPLRFARNDHNSYVTAGGSTDCETVDPRWANSPGLARDNG